MTMAPHWERSHAPLKRHLLVGPSCSIPHRCSLASWGRVQTHSG
jgi:hypothetical protein